MANSMPRNEAQSYVGGRPLEHKRPRTNVRYLSPLSYLTLAGGRTRGVSPPSLCNKAAKGRSKRKVDPHASYLA
eukprot:7574055-Pyramimonas_sp.AAC.1